VLPDLERLGEAVDVLGDAELADAPLLRDPAISLGVGGLELLGRQRLRLVGSQVDVIVGQHG
jgi:hypothetical protein